MLTFRNKINELSGLGLGGFDFRTHINAITGNGTAVYYKIDSEAASVSTTATGDPKASLSSSDASTAVQSTGEAGASVSSAAATVSITSGDGSACP